MTSPLIGEKLRIALAITELDVGGAEQCLVNLALGLDRTRFEPQVFCLAPRPSTGCDDLVRRLEYGKIPVHFVGAKSPRQFFTAIWKLRRLLRDHSPHVLQTFLFHANVVGTIAARWVGVPKIVTGIRVADPSKSRHRIERWLTRGAIKHVCVSNAVANFAQQRARLSAEKIIVIPNGIELRNYPSPNPAELSEFGVPAGKPVVLFVGRLDRQKGVDWLLNLLPQAFKSLPDFHLLVVGSGPEAVRLKEQARNAEIGDRVHFAGWQAEVPAIMASCDLLILLSRWEGMPNVLIEAMASKLPVISTKAEGVLEILGPLAENQSVEFGDDNGVVDRLGNLLRNRELAAELGRENRRRIADCFSLEQMIAAYENLYESLF